MLSILSDTQKAVLETVTMRLDLTNSLDYVKSVGFPMKRRTYYRHKKQIEDMKLERMRFIAKVVYEEAAPGASRQDGIDRKPDVDKLLEGKDRYKKVKILAEIVNIQPYISSYYEATKDLLEAQPKINQNQNLDFKPEPSKIPDVGWD